MQMSDNEISESLAELLVDTALFLIVLELSSTIPAFTQ